MTYLIIRSTIGIFIPSLSLSLVHIEELFVGTVSHSLTLELSCSTMFTDPLLSTLTVGNAFAAFDKGVL